MRIRRFFHSAFAGAILAVGWLAPPAAFFTGQHSQSAPPAHAGAPLFDWAVLQERARELAAAPYRPARAPDDPALRMSYDQYRSIAFDREQAVWAGEDTPFQLEMFHPGFIYETPVDVAVVEGGQARPIAFSPELYDYGGAARPPAADGLSFSGVRAHTQLNRRGVWDEFAVFQGGTYFRGVGRGQTYGLSARALAIATGHPRGEEFPHFRAFWVERAAPGASALTVYALMDSRSAAGAYRFTIMPGASTIMDVEMALFPRRDLDSVGLAPLTSMFLFDQTNRAGFDDYRDAVHDSDGLQILNGAGEPIWRPLANPRRLQISAFQDDAPRGFGLMQRKRDPADFGDLQADYEDRPSAWVEPLGDWGRGSVMLVEIPTEGEYNDNIVAFWRPAEPIRAGARYDAAWRVYWGADAPLGSALMRASHTRIGSSAAGHRFFAVDFDPGLTDLGADALEARASASAGSISQPHLAEDPQTGALRATFELDPQGADLVELRLQLIGADGAAASETWLYRWTPG